MEFCNHVKTNGIMCGSPALTDQDYCYFHTGAHERAKRQRRAAQLNLPFQLPLLEDANSIQIAINETLNALLAGRIDHKTAGLVLYGLQTAATNLRHTTLEISEDETACDFYDPDEEEIPEPQPSSSDTVAPPKQHALPPKKSPYAAEEKEILDLACEAAMERAHAIKEPCLPKPK